MTTIISKDEIKAGVAVGGSVTLVTRAAGFDLKKNTVIILDGTYDIGEGQRWQWHVKGTAAEPLPTTPVVVTPPVTGKHALEDGEALLQSDLATVGFNGGGGLGTINAAPAGFRTDTATGLKRVGFYSPLRNDVILQGRAVEGYALFIDGKRYANAMLNGQTQIPGKFIDAHRWLGEAGGVQVLQRATLDGANLAPVVELTNNTLRTITLSYMRFVDPDQSSDNAGGTANFSTASTAIAGGVECALYGGGTLYLRDTAGKATVRTAASVNKAADLGTALATGKTLKSDHVVQLVFAAVTLAPGQSVTHSFEMGVR